VKAVTKVAPSLHLSSMNLFYLEAFLEVPELKVSCTGEKAGHIVLIIGIVYPAERNAAYLNVKRAPLQEAIEGIF